MADTKSSANTPTKGATPQQAPSQSLGQRVAGFLRAPLVASPRGQRKPASSTTRFIIGSVTFILVAELLTYLIDYANLQFKLGLQQPIVPGASWLTWFFLINVVVILGLWLLLRRFGLFPTDMWNAQRTQPTRGSSGASGGGNGNGSKKAADQIPGIGKVRTRAERRYSANLAAEAAAAAAAKASKGKNRASATKSTAGATATLEATSADANQSYDRVRAAQRQRKRRALR